MRRNFPIDIDEIGEQLPSLDRRAGWRAIGSFGEGVISRPSSALGKWGKRRGRKKKEGPALDCLRRYISYTYLYPGTAFPGTAGATATATTELLACLLWQVRLIRACACLL